MATILNFRTTIAFGFGFILLFATGCITFQENPVSGNRRAMGYTWDQELQIGRDADRQIVAHYGLYDNEEVHNYVNAVAKAVLEHSHMRREDTSRQFREAEFTFRVLNSDVINAFALPGGYIYVTRGLLTHLNNEAQLAMILGHEIVHVAARHASQRAFEQQAGSILLLGGAVVGQEVFGMSAENILNIGGTAAQLLFLSYSRGNERESDTNGVEYAVMAGYDASEAAGFFRTLSRLTEQSGGARLPNHLSSHPDPGDREQSMHRLSQRWKERGYDQPLVRQDEYLDMINQMILGPNPREGFVQNSNFYHPDLEFQYPVPSGWRVQNEASQVVVYQSDQRAISVFTFAGGANNAREAVEQFTSQDGITTESSQQRNIGDIPGYMAIATATDQGGNRLKIMVQGLEHKGNVYRFINYSREAEYSGFESNFNQIVTGFRTLTDPDILATRPVRLDIRTTQRSGTLRSFLPDELPMGIDHETVAILNQMNLDDNVSSGQRIKIPVQ